MSKKSIATQTWEQLLYLYDFHIRNIAKARAAGRDDQYDAGYADGIGQIILDLGKIHGEGWEKPHKHEAYKRIMEFTSAEAYVIDYPEAVENPRQV